MMTHRPCSTVAVGSGSTAVVVYAIVLCLFVVELLPSAAESQEAAAIKIARSADGQAWRLASLPHGKQNIAVNLKSPPTRRNDDAVVGHGFIEDGSIFILRKDGNVTIVPSRVNDDVNAAGKMLLAPSACALSADGKNNNDDIILFGLARTSVDDKPADSRLTMHRSSRAEATVNVIGVNAVTGKVRNFFFHLIHATGPSFNSKIATLVRMFLSHKY